MPHPAPQPPAYPPPATAPAKKRSSRLGIIIGGVVALVLIGCVAAVALFLFRGAPDPAKALPADADLVVTLDLNPSNAKKLEIYQFLTRFPSLKEQLSSEEEFSTDPRKAIWKATFGQNSDIDYDAEIKPWLGDSVGVAIRNAPGSAKPAVVTAVHATSPEQGREFFRKRDANSQVSVAGNFVIIASGDGAAELAESAKTKPLSSSKTYADDMKHVGDGMITAWAGESLVPALSQRSGVNVPSHATQVRGALSLDISATNTEVKLWHTTGQSLPSRDVRELVGSLPGDRTWSVAAASFNETMVADMYAAVKPLLGRDLEQAAKSLGLTLPTDLATLFGDETALVGYLAHQGQGEPSAKNGYALALVSRSSDTNKQLQLWSKLLTGFERNGVPLGLVPVVEGDRLGVATSEQELRPLLAPSGAPLANDESYRGAVDTAAPAYAIVYLDMVKFLDVQAAISAQFGQPFRVPEDLRAIRAVGLTFSRIDDRSATITMKVQVR
ncbi:MAG: DUF3352 domain-containing protein [Propionibacteriaceae bacterium]|nr:DUF3352 domain-containing protein [Propionibacteriaceae bacterium]